MTRLRTSVWDDERRELVRRLRAQGLGVKTIAVQLGVSKNAICGLLNRMRRDGEMDVDKRTPHRNRRSGEPQWLKHEREIAERDAAAWLAVPIPSWVPRHLTDDYRDFTALYGEERAASIIRAKKRESKVGSSG